MRDINKILKKGEGLTVEFKKATNKLPDNLFETVCAFLNRNGGEIVLGINDNKKIEGINEDKVNTLCKQISNLSNNPQKLNPSFLLFPETLEHKNKKLIYLFVPSSSQVHRCNNKIFDRSVDGDYELKTNEQIKNLYNRKNILYSENLIYPYLKEEHFVPGIVEKTRKIIKINRSQHSWNNLSDSEFFVTSGLYRTDLSENKEGFTMSALLLFGRDEIIQSAIPHYKIDALLRKKNLDRYDDRENIRCNLIDAYDKLMTFTEKHLSDKFYLEGTQRISLRDAIFREIIANMLIHREYTNAFPSSFIIYNNMVETKNANKPVFIGQLFPGKFEPFPKNPNIAQIFTQMGLSEELGTGVTNVFKYSQAYSGNSNIVFEENDIFICKVPIKAENVTENVTENRLNIILKEISKSPDISYDQLSKKLKVARMTIYRDIEKLKKQKKIKRVGPDKGGYWKVNE